MGLNKDKEFKYYKMEGKRGDCGKMGYGFDGFETVVILIYC